MRLIPTQYLREGSYMGLDLLDSQGRLLLPTGRVINESGLRIIKNLGIANVYVYDRYSFDERENIHLVKKLDLFVDIISRLKKIRAKITEGKALQSTIKEVEFIAERLVDAVYADRSSLKIEYEAPKLNSPEVEKLLYVALMSIILGIKMGLDKKELINLCISALLRDVGLLIIELIKKEGKIEPPSNHEYPLVGGRYLIKYKINVEIAYAIMQHRELEDGTGFPRGLTGDKTTLNAKIISTIITFFDIWESHDPYQEPNKKLEKRLFKMLENSDKDIMRKFIFNTSIYKTDTLVKLNTGDIVVIYSNNKYNPFRPIVKILKGNVYKEGELINLRTTRNVRIDRVVYYTN